MSKRTNKRNSKRIVTPSMEAHQQQRAMQEWAQQGIEIVQALKDPPSIPAHNEILKRIRAAAVLSVIGAIRRETAVEWMAYCIHAAYWLGKGANLAEETFKQNGSDADQTADKSDQPN